jgi:hypothetical protein
VVQAEALMSINNNGNRRIQVAAWLAAGLVCAIPFAVCAQERPSRRRSLER